MNELIKIDEDGRTSVRETYEFLELSPSQFSRWCKTNIENNEFYQEGVDWWGFDIMSNGNETKDYKLTIDFAKHLCMMQKNERGKLARCYFVDVEKRFKQIYPLPQMTQTQIIAEIARNAAEQEKKIFQLEARTENVERKLTLVKDTFVDRKDNWRENTNSMINRIAQSFSNKDYKAVRCEAYEILEERAKCRLAVRVIRLKNRLQETGATKTTINNVNKMSVIEVDPKLKEIFTSIIKEMTIKYVA